MSDRLEYLKRKQVHIEERIKEYKERLNEYQRNRQKNIKMIEELKEELKSTNIKNFCTIVEKENWGSFMKKLIDFTAVIWYDGDELKYDELFPYYNKCIVICHYDQKDLSVDNNIDIEEEVISNEEFIKKAAML